MTAPVMDPDGVRAMGVIIAILLYVYLMAPRPEDSDGDTFH